MAGGVIGSGTGRVFGVVTGGGVEFGGFVGCVGFALGYGGSCLVDVGDFLFLVIGEGDVGRRFKELLPELGKGGKIGQ